MNPKRLRQGYLNFIPRGFPRQVRPRAHGVQKWQRCWDRIIAASICTEKLDFSTALCVPVVPGEFWCPESALTPGFVGEISGSSLMTV